MESALPTLDPALMNEFNRELLKAMIAAVKTLQSVMADAAPAAFPLSPRAATTPLGDPSERFLPARLAAISVLRTRFLKAPGVDAPELVRARISPSPSPPSPSKSPSPSPSSSLALAASAPAAPSATSPPSAASLPSIRSQPAPSHTAIPAPAAPARTLRPSPAASLLNRMHSPGASSLPLASTSDHALDLSAFTAHPVSLIQPLPINAHAPPPTRANPWSSGQDSS